MLLVDDPVHVCQLHNLHTTTSAPTTPTSTATEPAARSIASVAWNKEKSLWKQAFPCSGYDQYPRPTASISMQQKSWLDWCFALSQRRLQKLPSPGTGHREPWWEFALQQSVRRVFGVHDGAEVGSARLSFRNNSLLYQDEQLLLGRKKHTRRLA